MNISSESFPQSDRDHLEHTEWSELVSTYVDARAALSEVVSALQILAAETSPSASPLLMTRSLIDLHGALLVFELAGRAELIPSVPIGVTTRRGLERRVVSSARALAGSGRGGDAAFAAWKRAAGRIEDLIDLIDPDLRLSLAS